MPPTVALCRQHFGIERSGVVFGWVFAAHMVGAGVAASFAGWIRTVQGDYFMAWLTAGGLCVLAAGACLLIPKRRPRVPRLTGRDRADPARAGSPIWRSPAGFCQDSPVASAGLPGCATS